MNYEQIVMGVVTGGALVKAIEVGVNRMNRKDELAADSHKSLRAENQRLQEDLEECRGQRLADAEEGLEVKAQVANLAAVTAALREEVVILKDSNMLLSNEVARLRASNRELHDEVMSLREQLRTE